VRMQHVLAAVREWIPGWEERTEYGGHRGIVGIGAVNGGFAWRVSRTPHRTDLFLDVRVPPTLPMARARAELGDLVRGLRERFPDPGLGENLDIEGLVRTAQVYALVAARVCGAA